VEKVIVILLIGYHPIKEKLTELKSSYENMPKSRIDNDFEGQVIQKCGVSIEEIDFGFLDDKPSVKTLILYNYSTTENCEFEFINPGFNMKDEIQIDPPKGVLEPTKHLLIKLKLVPLSLSSYTGELEIKINWNITESKDKEQKEIKEKSSREVEKEKLFVRVMKKSLIKEVENIFKIDFREHG